MDARETALLTLNACERQGGWSDGALKKQISAAGLDSRDAALATQLCAGVLQNQMLLDFYLAHFSNLPLKRMEGRVVQALRLGAYQMLFLDRIPHSAAVNRSVELTRAYCKNPRAAGMVNGILRSLEQITPHLPAPECLALENLERHPTDYLDKLVSATPHSRCFDIGHVWKEGLRPEELLPLWLPDIRMCHLHGLEKRDHKSLHHMPAATLDAILHPMWDIRFSPLITLEVFSLDDFLNSHQAMLESHERYTSKH